MATRNAVQADHDDCSGRISEQTRTISLAILAIVWLFLASKDKPTLVSLPNVESLLIIGGLCLLALIADYFQYLAGYFSSKKLLDEADTLKKEDGIEYNYSDCLYRARTLMFTLKQVSVLSAAVILRGFKFEVQRLT
jgi:hypothetical protein